MGIRSRLSTAIAIVLAAVVAAWNGLPEPIKKVLRDCVLVALMLVAGFNWFLPHTIADAQAEAFSFWSLLVVAIAAVVRTEAIPLARDRLAGLIAWLQAV